jgi:hypothetical protein
MDKLANIRFGKVNLSELKPTNIFVNERWLEAHCLITWMTMHEPKARPSTAEVINHIFFKDEDERYVIVNKALKLIKSGNENLKKRVAQFIRVTITPFIDQLS